MKPGPKPISGIPSDGDSVESRKEDKLFSRISSKTENCIAEAEASFRVYYGATGAVPFMWESQPGTPKHSSFSSSIPPLTPPPSYYTKSREESAVKEQKSKLFFTLFSPLRLFRRNAHVTPSSSISCSSSSSSFSSETGRGRFSFCSSFRLASLGVAEEEDEEEDRDFGSPTSTLCFFGPGHGRCKGGSLKTKSLSTASHRSGHAI